MGKTALVTGASRGIGRAFAEEIAKDRFDIILVARNLEQLEEVAAKLQQQYAIKTYIISHDLSAPSQAEALFQKVQDLGCQVDLLVNNAGIGLCGLFHESDANRLSQMLYLNIVSLSELTRQFLPQMVQRKVGTIINIASTAAFQPGPCMAIYYASKSYVLSFSEALYYELKPYGVGVTVVCPGPTDTDFFEPAKMQGTRLITAHFDMMSAEKVAQIGYRGAKAKKRIVVAGCLNRFLSVLTRLVPHSLSLPVVKYLHGKKIVEKKGDNS